MNRQRLSTLVACLLLLLIMGFCYILFASLSGSDFSDGNKNISDQTKLFDVPNGETQLRRYQKKRVWVTHLSTQQRQQHGTLDDWLVNPRSGCDTQQALCLIKTDTTRFGIEVRFVINKPPQLADNLPWLGGFIDPTNGTVYDLFGRAYNKTLPSNKPTTDTQDISILLNNPTQVSQ